MLEYLRAYRSNFRQSTLSFLPLGAVEGLLLAECITTQYLQEQGAIIGSLRPLFLALVYLTGLWIVYVSAYAARFQDPISKTILQSAILAMANPGKSILLLFLLAFSAFAVRLFPPLILIIPGLYIWIAHKILEKVFVRHLADVE